MLLIAASLGVAAGAALGSEVGWILFLGTAALPAVLLVRSTVQIEVSNGVLRVDRATLPVNQIGDVRVLDAEQARRERGPDLDPACHLVLRGWVPTAVRIENIDAQDPVPYWYLSTRDPDGLKRAIEQARAGS